MSSLPFLLFQVALETLLLRGPQKPQTHPLSDYRYTGDYSKVPVWFCLAEIPVNPSTLVASSACLGVSSGASSALPEGPVLSGVTPWVPFASRWTLPSPFLVVPSWAPPDRSACPWPGEAEAGTGVRRPGFPPALGKLLNHGEPQLLHVCGGDGNGPYLLRF